MGFDGANANWETGMLTLLFNNTVTTDVGYIGGSSIAASGTPGSLYISLHTADPGNGGSQTTSEVTTGAYAGYARVAVARSTGGWTVSGSNPAQAANAATVTFPLCTGGSGATVTYVGIGVDNGAHNILLYSAQLTSSLAVSNNITPSFAIGSLVVTFL